MKFKLLFCSSLFIQSLYSQENIIKTYPIKFLLGTFDMKYERTIAPKISFGGNLELSYLKKRQVGLLLEDGIGLEFYCKFSISDSSKFPKGWYLAPVTGYASGFPVVFVFPFSQEKSVYYLGGIIGHQWIWGKNKKGFVLDINGGLQYVNLQKTVDERMLTIYPRLGISIGYAF